MTRWFAFLRAINVGGRTVKMDRLRELFAELGLENVQSFIASGNLLFVDPRREGGTVEREIETHLEVSLGYEVATFLRTFDEIAGASAAEPFGPGGASRHYIGFARGIIDPEPAERIRALESPTDRLRVIGREIHWACETSSRDSPISGAVLERALGGPLTFRNRNTIDRLIAKYAGATDA